MKSRRPIPAGFAAVAGVLLFVPLRAQGVDPADSYLPVFIESAWGLKPGQTVSWSGVEFEEDSGEFPTFKTVLHLRRGLSNRVLVYGTAELIRFNSETYTAWGGSNPAFGLQYRLPLPSEDVWGLQLKAELLPAWGGFASAGTSFSTGLDFSRRLGSFGFHVNGIATAGPTDNRTVWVSEVDKWRVSAGYDWHTKGRDWTIMMAFIRAQPLRPKPVETSLEMGILRRLSSSWSAGAGAGAGLTEKGQEYILRFGLRYAAD